jgi:hypothetical protein
MTGFSVNAYERLTVSTEYQSVRFQQRKRSIPCRHDPKYRYLFRTVG